MPMDMKSPVRQIEGRVIVNFFANSVDTDVFVLDTSNNFFDDTYPNISKQIFAYDLNIDKKIALLDGSTRLADISTPKENCYYLMDKTSKVGWWGNTASGAVTKKFESGKEPYISVKFDFSRDLTYMLIKGDVLRNEYPEEFDLEFYTEPDEGFEEDNLQTYRFLKKIVVDKLSGIKNFTFDANRAEYNVSLLGDNGGALANVRAVKLIIKKWSKGGTVAKINYFSSEMIVPFAGNKLKNIEVLEEKTGAVEKLEYGVTGSNYCKVGLFNDGYKFFEDKNFALLRKNRTVTPYIKCGDDCKCGEDCACGPNCNCDGFYPLGKFYSDEWNLDAGSHFFTVKAYDILYGLQTLIINYGMDGKTKEGTTINSGEEISIMPYKERSIRDIITRVETLINDERIKNGIIGSALKIEPRGFTASLLNDWKLPYTLIEEKSAWDVLKDIGVLCCAFVYVDRNGTIVIERDNFNAYNDKGNLLYKETDELNPNDTFYTNKNKDIVINESNAFTYSLPVTSKTVVNKVNVEYYDMVVSSYEDKPDKVGVKIKDINEIGNDDTKEGYKIFEATVSLPKIYEEIKNISVENLAQFTLKFIAYDKLIIRFSSSTINDFDVFFNFELIEPKPTGYKLEKNTYTDQRELSINRHGLNEYTCKCGNLLLRPLVDADGDNYGRIVNISDRILNKYSEGVSFLVSDWKGNDALEVSKTFNSENKTYECLSNDIKFDTKFRMKTKGRERINQIN